MRRRLCCALVAIALTSSSGFAQDGLRSASLPERPPQQPIPPARTDLYRVPPDFYTTMRPQGPGLPIYGYGPYLGPSPDPWGTERFERDRSGFLDLQMRPGNAQVYVDGYYMGSVDDFRRMIPGRSIQAGAHRVEVRASGYEPRSFDVMIPPNETVTYRADLESSTPSAPAVTLPPAMPKTFYVIPGCYAGDRPPRGRLPRGCDKSKLRAIPPTPAASASR